MFLEKAYNNINDSSYLEQLAKSDQVTEIANANFWIKFNVYDYDCCIYTY